MQHKESNIQQAAYRWFCLQYPQYRILFFSVPNGAKVSRSQARILRAEGLTKGVADTILLVPRNGYHGLAIEFKTEKGRQSPEQKEWQRSVQREDYMYKIVRSFEEFKDTIEEYIGMSESPIQQLIKTLNRQK